jgi:hypothetical protein
MHGNAGVTAWCPPERMCHGDELAEAIRAAATKGEA